MLLHSFKQWLTAHWGNALWIVILIAFLANVFYLIAPQSQTPITLEPLNKITINSIETNDASDETIDETDAIAETHTTKKTGRSFAKKHLAKVHLNTASITELQHLPGVGIKMAGRILSYRKQIGKFTSCDELTNVSGIGPKKLAKMKPYCLL